MANKPWDSSAPPTAAEQRLDELLGQSRPWGRKPDEIQRLDVHAEMFDPQREIRGEYLSRKLVESPEAAGWRAFWRGGGQQPVIRIEDSVITGQLNLRAAELPYLLEFARCRFDNPPDFRQSNLAGLVLSGCRFPGITARNITVDNDTVFEFCSSFGGIVDIADSQLGGSLILNDSDLRNPGRRAMYADRLSVAGALLGLRVKVSGELRIPGAKVGGNLNFSGGALRNRGRIAVNANGIQIGGSFRGDIDPRGTAPFTVAGLLYMPSASVQGDLRLRSAILEPGIATAVRGASRHDDPTSTLIIDRGEIRGDIQLDKGFRSGGTIRMVSARIGGDLRMSDANIDLSWSRSPTDSVHQPLRAVHFDGTELAGNLDASGLVAHGQLRLADAHVRGSFQLNQVQLLGPRTDVVQCNRIRVGSNFDCRNSSISGSLQFQGASFGANLDLRASTLIKPAWHRHRQTYKPSVDLRAARVGRDLVCAAGARPFSSDGEVQLRRAIIERQANFTGCRIGEDGNRSAINAFGLVAQDLTLQPDIPPRGRIELQQAQCELFTDNARLWSATRGIDVEDFTYDNLQEPIDPTDQRPVRERLSWLRATSDGKYQPGPYDQLANVYRDSGNEEHAVTVLIEKQRRRYQAIAKASSWFIRLPVQIWSALQRYTVSYGYRPIRALTWLLFFGIAGTTWFSLNDPLVPINQDDRPIWNPFLYTVDQLVPIINLGHDVMWRAEGHSQWITVTLITAGWILATTVAAGISRTLRRER